MNEITVDREPEKRKVERELNYFRAWFSVLTFLLTAVAFIIGFPALEDAGSKIGLGQLAFGLPFAIDLGMVTLLLWSMWNRGALKRWWPPLIPAGLLLGLSSWLQYIHAVELISPETPELARWGLLILASALPLLLALSAGVFEAVTFAPLIDRAKRHTEVLLEQQKADDELWRIEMEQRRASSELDAKLKRSRIEIESETQLSLIQAEADAATKALRNQKSGTKTSKTVATAVKPTPQRVEPPRTEKVEAILHEPLTEIESTTLASEPPLPEASKKNLLEPTVGENEAMASAVKAVQEGAMSQRAAAEYYQVPRSALRRNLGS